MSPSSDWPADAGRVQEQVTEGDDVIRLLGEAEAELSSHRLLLREQVELLDLARDAILVRERDGTILFWNRGAERLYGWTAQEAIGRRSHELLHTRAPLTVEELERLMLSQGFWSGEVRHRRRDGKELVVESQRVPQRATSDHVERILEINTDVTEERQTQAELERANRDLAVANEVKSRFMASISHELRTPLNAVLGFSGLLLQEEPGSDEDRLGFAAHIHAAGLHLLDLVQQVLDFTDLQAGSVTLHKERVDLCDLLEQVHAAMTLHGDEKGVDLRLDECGVPYVDADPGRLRQIIYNLLSNALKFTPSGGTVRLTARRRDGMVAVSVTDSGPGIAADVQERLFQPFDQGAITVSQGMGIGLPVARLLAEAHGGRLEVQSEVGGGSTLTVLLPDGG